MPSARTRKTSFNGGEVAEDVHGRDELAKVQSGAKLLYNMFVLSYGGACNRAGLQFVREVKFSDDNVELFRFEAEGDAAIVLETGPLYFRYHFEGGTIESAPDVPVETVTVYDEGDLDALQMAQSNDVATVVHTRHPVYELARTGATTFSYGAVSFAPTAGVPGNLAQVTTNPYITVPTGGATKQYDYAVSAIVSTGEEGLLSVPVTCDLVLLGFDANWVDLTWDTVTDATEYEIYKKDTGSDIWGFIGRATSLSFRDDGIEPSTAEGPQSWDNPFNATDEYPGLVSFGQQRRVFCKQNNAKQGMHLSQSAAFNNFGKSIPSRSTDAIFFNLAALSKQDIYHVLGLEKGFLVFTRAGEWRVRGRDGEVIEPASVFPEPQSYWGSSPLVGPIIAGEQILFLTRTQKAIRDFGYTVTEDRYKSTSLTLFAHHLFDDRKVIDWAFCQSPYGLLYVVFDDGEAACLTYLREHKVWGWSRMKTAGLLLRVVSVPEGGRDVPYFLVQRYINGSYKKYIEFLHDREFMDQRDAFFVDSGLTFDNPISLVGVTLATSTILEVTGHGWSVGNILDLNKVEFHDDTLETKKTLNGRYQISEVVDVDHVRIVTEDYEDAVDTSAYVGLIMRTGAVVRLCVTTVSGFDHLEGKTCIALCDGNVVEDIVISGGAWTFDRAYARIHLGLPMVAKAESLDGIVPNANDEGMLKGQPTVHVRIKDTRGVKWGPNFDKLVELKGRDKENYKEPNALKTGLYEIDFIDGYDHEATVCAQQDLPLPFTWQGVVQEIEYGGS